jgi:putative copper export protein
MPRMFLVAVELLSAPVWVGGLVVLGIVAPIARRELDPATRIRFFRSLGRRYLAVGS